MNDMSMQVIRGYFDNVQVNLQTVQYTKVTAGWGATVKLPEVTRLYFIREGEGWISIRNRVYYPKRGQLFLLPAGQSIAFDTHAEHTFGKYWCHFSATVGDINLFHFIDLPYFIEVPNEAKLEQQFQNLIGLYNNPSLTSPLRIKSSLLDIIAMYLEQASLQDEQAVRSISAKDTDKIHTILVYIEQHLESHVTIEELARLVHFHPQYLILYFKSMLGVSPIAYINRKRIEKAKQLLPNQTLTISDIAAQIGMEAYYFSRMFKKQTGVSPSDYRRYVAQSTMGMEI